MRLVALSTSTWSFCSEGRYRALMVTAPYFSELVSSWTVGYKDKVQGWVLIPIMEGRHRAWQRLSRNFGVPGCAGILWDALSPLLLNVDKPAPTTPGVGGWWGKFPFPQAGPVS